MFFCIAFKTSPYLCKLNQTYTDTIITQYIVLGKKKLHNNAVFTQKNSATEATLKADNGNRTRDLLTTKNI